jgi:hypothetical protein
MLLVEIFMEELNMLSKNIESKKNPDITIGIFIFILLVDFESNLNTS